MLVDLEVPRDFPTHGRTQTLVHTCSYVGGDGTPEVADPPVRIRYAFTHSPGHLLLKIEGEDMLAVDSELSASCVTEGLR